MMSILGLNTVATTKPCTPIAQKGLNTFKLYNPALHHMTTLRGA